MKKYIALFFLLLAFAGHTQTTQSIAGQWTISKVIKVEGMSAAKLKKGKEMLEGNVILTFNADGTFKSTASTKKEAKTWLYQRKKKTILINSKSEKLKIKILKFKTESMRVKMQLSKSVVGEFLLVKN